MSVSGGFFQSSSGLVWMNFDQCADVSGERISFRQRPAELDSKHSNHLPRDTEVHHANGKKGAKQPDPGALRI